jgi:7-keto-8-aminopelargonate synthetase-like enzyme
LAEKSFELSLNDYLGLAESSRGEKADTDAAKIRAAYPMGARMMSGIQNTMNN